MGRARAPAQPSKPHAPGSGLLAPAHPTKGSSTSHQREEEREGETLELTQSKTKESKMRVAGGNADVLQAYSRLGNKARLLVGQDREDAVGPDP